MATFVYYGLLAFLNVHEFPNTIESDVILNWLDSSDVEKWTVFKNFIETDSERFYKFLRKVIPYQGSC